MLLYEVQFSFTTLVSENVSLRLSDCRFEIGVCALLNV